MKNTKKLVDFMHKQELFAALTVAGLMVATAGNVYAQTLTRQLSLGSSGTDVSALQTFLASDPTLYPSGRVTGYFGSLTAAAVSKFQTRNGLAAVGRVGPATLPLINAQMGTGTTGTSGGTGGAPAITGLSANGTAGTTATISWNTNEPAKGIVYYSLTPLSTTEGTNSVSVSGSTAVTDTSYHTTQSVLLSGLQPNATYYYLVYATDQSGNVSVSWPAAFQTSASSTATATSNGLNINAIVPTGTSTVATTTATTTTTTTTTTATTTATSTTM